MEQNNNNHDCKCLGDKKVKSLEKQVSDLKLTVEKLLKEVSNIRKAVR